ncbi:MAG: ribonuclease D [Alphaproteobacteria bacterium]
MTIRLHQGDLPAPVDYPNGVAIDTETMGLNPHRDRLCLVQLSAGDGTVDMVQIAQGQTEAPNLVALLTDVNVTKIFHFARFDLAVLSHAFGIEVAPAWCTKIASKLIRTYTDRHGLKDLARELIGQDMSKQQQSSDWGSADLTNAQKNYAASDVLYLHQMKDVLEQRLIREDRLALAQACFGFLPTRAALDLAGWNDIDIFAHS